MRKHISEVFLTKDNVTADEWLNFILEISKLNGLFNSWKLYMKIEKNIVTYYIETKRNIPTILNYSGSFLIKEVKREEFRKINGKMYPSYFVKNNENNIIEIYEKNESKYSNILKQVEIKILPYKRDNYLTKANLYFQTSLSKEKKNNNLKKYIRRKAYFLIPHIGFSIDFGKHTRFLYKKEGYKYLNIQKSVELFNEEPSKNDLLEIQGFPYFKDKYYLNMLNYDFAKHSLIVGASGTGKSKLIEKFITNIYEDEDLREKYKIVLIDPHSSIENDLKDIIDDMKIINMNSKETSSDLWINSTEDISSNTEILLSIFKDIFGEEYNSKLERVLRHSIYLLLKNKGLNFKNLRKLLTEVNYRTKLVNTTENLEDNIKEFFFGDFNEIKTKSYQEAIDPIIALIDEMQMLPAFREESNKEIEDIIKENFLSIFSINQAKLGERVTKIIAGLIIGVMFQLVQRKVFKQHIIFIIDEVSIVENTILRNLLSEARKYNLSLILAGQYLGQVSNELKKAIFSNVLNYYCFRVSREDAIELSNNMQMEMSVHNTYHNRIKLLSELENRKCIARVSKAGVVKPAFITRTLDFDERKKDQETNIKIEEMSVEKNADDKALGANSKNANGTIIKEIDFEVGKPIDLKKLIGANANSNT